MFEAISLFAWLAGVSGAPVPAVDPLTQPIESSRAAEWLAPAEPEKIFGTSYLVGFAGMSVALIDTGDGLVLRSEEHTPELQSLMRISYAVFCLKKKHKTTTS